ncbi:MAG: V-type ATP synthase subunit D [Thermoprotei archaeon]|nr:MAG: V-type ATP synthase subunit D [Thermoprotei archaeon]RLF15830.1 MAG: V-type ATP synthase subunit D [Thermoprotei archaeon]
MSAGGLDFKPTRMELIALRRKRKLAERGLSLLKEKRDALVMELLEVLREYRTLKEGVTKIVTEAYKKLAEAKMELGPLKVMEIAASSPTSYDVKLRLRSIMGVKVPTLTLNEITDTSKPTYSLADTCSSLDEAVKAFRDALNSIVRLAEIEASIRGLAEEVKKAKRRVNALETVIIPRFDKAIKYIELYLDERAREDVFRIRILKSRRAKR